MEKKIEKFISEYCTPEDPVLEELYRQTHIRFVNPSMVSGHVQGKILEMISMMIKPDNILEIGTFTGYSAICLAKGLKQEGKLYTIESNDELTSFSRSYFEKAKVSSKIVQLTGRAQDIIPTIDCAFDLVYIDGDKREYVEYFRLVIGKIVSGGYIIADNVFWGGKVFHKETRDPQAKGIIGFNELIKNEAGIEFVIIPLRDGLMLIRKK